MQCKEWEERSRAKIEQKGGNVERRTKWHQRTAINFQFRRFGVGHKTESCHAPRSANNTGFLENSRSRRERERRSKLRNVMPWHMLAWKEIFLSRRASSWRKNYGLQFVRLVNWPVNAFQKATQWDSLTSQLRFKMRLFSRLLMSQWHGRWSSFGRGGLDVMSIGCLMQRCDKFRWTGPGLIESYFRFCRDDDFLASFQPAQCSTHM